MLFVTVAVAPRKLQITPNQSIYQSGDRIECSAEGNPAPSYQWTKLVSGTVIKGSVLVISEDMVNNIYAFQCAASNQYNGEHYTITGNIAFTVKGIDLHLHT